MILKARLCLDKLCASGDSRFAQMGFLLIGLASAWLEQAQDVQ